MFSLTEICLLLTAAACSLVRVLPCLRTYRCRVAANAEKFSASSGLAE
jgi:hypothetical protein